MINSKRIKSSGHGARLEETRNKYKILVEKGDRKRPTWKPRYRGEDVIKMDVSKTV
jgi:hypothetical protein